MRYLLVVITHGRSPHLHDAVAAFRRYVAPSPVRGLLWVDGPDLDDAAASVIEFHGSHDWTFTGSSKQRGFCVTYADAWQEAVEEAERLEAEHVFWLESDFLFTRPVDLEALAQLLEREPSLAQVAFMRNPCNEQEVAAGGLFESRPGEYAPHLMTVTQEPIMHGVRMRGYPWLLHSSYFTTNPSLMRTDFMARHPWPTYDAVCEGLFTSDLREDGLQFAVWGDGTPWVTHVGTRTGFGY